MEGTKNRIFHQAVEMFGTKGYDAVSIRNLTREVGIKESSFYNHYISKEALLEDIFRLMESELGKNKPDSVQIDKMTSELDLGEYLKRGIDIFLKSWNEPHASKVWAVVSLEQYRNKKAANLIIKETANTINILKKAFTFFQNKKKMKKDDPLLLAHLYGYSVRAIHLDYSLRSFTNNNPEYSHRKLYETATLFAKIYTINNQK